MRTVGEHALVRLGKSIQTVTKVFWLIHRPLLGSTSSSVAIPQLESMMEKTDTNEALLLKMKDWFALMNR